MVQPTAPINDPFDPHWDPRYLTCLTRPDPRYYRYVPDLSCYFVVAHHQSAGWQPGEGHPSSIRWLRNAAPELVAADGRLATPADDVTRGQPVSSAAANTILEPPTRPQEPRRMSMACSPPAPPVATRPHAADLPEIRRAPPPSASAPRQESHSSAPVATAATGGARYGPEMEPRRKVHVHHDEKAHRAGHLDPEDYPLSYPPTSRTNQDGSRQFDRPVQDGPGHPQQRLHQKPPNRGSQVHDGPGEQPWRECQSVHVLPPASEPIRQMKANSQHCWKPGSVDQGHGDRGCRPRDLSSSYNSEQQPPTATTTTTRKVSGSSGEQEHGSCGFWPETTEISAPNDGPGPVRRVDPDVLHDAHKLPMGHPDSPWGWPENSDTQPSAAARRAADDKQRHRGVYVTREEQNEDISKRPRRLPNENRPTSGHWQSQDTPAIDVRTQNEPNAGEQRPNTVPPTPASGSSDLSYLAGYYENLALQCRNKTLSAREARAAAVAASTSANNRNRHRDENFASRPQPSTNNPSGDGDGDEWASSSWNGRAPKVGRDWSEPPRHSSDHEEGWGSGFHYLGEQRDPRPDSLSPWTLPPPGDWNSRSSSFAPADFFNNSEDHSAPHQQRPRDPEAYSWHHTSAEKDRSYPLRHEIRRPCSPPRAQNRGPTSIPKDFMPNNTHPLLWYRYQEGNSQAGRSDRDLSPLNCGW